ncbi:MAG: membrane protein insertion efficiency factor YidD [Candidatus Nanopelagicales bacterium]
MAWPLLALIRLYQWTISPLLGPVCRYHPSCSRYAYGAIAVHGPLLGTFLAVRRVLRCNPWMPGGPDPVPPRGGVRRMLGQQRTERRRRSTDRRSRPPSTIVRGV